MAETIRLAIIGAGAITELLHLPAAKATENFELVALFDFNTERAQQLADTYGIPLAAGNYHNHLDVFDAAIVATPNITHADITIALIKAGKHVLVEKPAAFSSKQLEDMITAEAAGNAKVVVAQVKRFYPYHVFIKKLLASQTFGKLKRIDIQYSTVYAYPMASDSFLKKETSGGGVFFDMGVHYLDLVYWWLGNMDVITYKDDALDGIDASAYVQVTAGADKVPVSVTLGRLRNLPPIMEFEFETVTLQLRSVYGDMYTIKTPAGGMIGSLPGLSERPYLENGVNQLKAFAQTITANQAPAVSLQDALSVIKVIEQAYAQKQPITYEWERVEL